MKVSTKGRYAIIIMIELAKNYKNETFLSLSEIAEKNNLSLKYLEKIITLLNKEDYFITSRGSVGGYKLKYEPKNYKMIDILKATEKDIEPVQCVKDDSFCIKKSNCAIFSFWNGLNNAINNYLENTTLQDYI